MSQLLLLPRGVGGTDCPLSKGPPFPPPTESHRWRAKQVELGFSAGETEAWGGQ